MKKVILFALGIAASATMMAQKPLQFGVEAGFDHSDLTLKASAGSGTEKRSNGMNGFHVGPTFKYDLVNGTHGVSLTAGVYYQFLKSDWPGAIFPDSDSKAEYKQYVKEYKQELKEEGCTNIDLEAAIYSHAIQIPIRARYSYTLNNDLKIFGYTGPMFNIYASRYFRDAMLFNYEGKRNGAEERLYFDSGKITGTIWNEGEKESESDKDEDGKITRPIDITWGIGLGANWKNFELSVSYDFGMLNQLKKNFLGDDVKARFGSNELKVSLGYWF